MMKCKGHKGTLRFHVYRQSGEDCFGFTRRRLVCCASPGEAVRRYLSIARLIRHGAVFVVGRRGVLGSTDCNQAPR